MSPNQVGRLTVRVLTRLASYKKLQLVIEMELQHNAPFTLPVDTMYESCYNEAAGIVAHHIKRPVGEVLWCLEHYLHQ